MKRLFVAAILVAAALEPLNAQTSARANDITNLEAQRVEPFKVFDNLYFVGVKYVSAWIVKTDAGLILIDTLYEPFGDLLIENIKALGFDPKDIKYVIGTHAHYDHTGNALTLQDKYGARVAMSEEDWQFLPKSKPPHPRRDLVLKNGDTLTLGNVTMRFSVMPSHTPGVVAIEFPVFERGQPYKALVQPPIEKDGKPESLASIARLEKMEGIQVSVWVHPIMDRQFWERVDKLKKRQPGEPNPFIAPEAFQTRIDFLKKPAP